MGKHSKWYKWITLAVLAFCLIGAGMMSLKTSSPLLTAIIILLIALLALASFLERRHRVMWPLLAIVSALFAAMAAYEWAETWIGSRRIVAVAILAIISAAGAVAAVVDGIRVWNRRMPQP
jgi:hypothetical protein